jgi:glutamine synthetase
VCSSDLAGINGSGKHNNWSMSTDTGENLLNPGETPHKNAQFIVFICAVIRAVNKYAELLRMTVCGSGNDHRLGANEAPPAILSIFLGDQLTDIIQQIEKGGAKSTKHGGKFETGVSVLPTLPKDAGDRNRTSPFAFTGNKFEFRAVGSSQNVAGPNTVLNAIVAESLDFISTQLEAKVKAGEDLLKAVQDLLPGLIKANKRIVFNGDNYTEEWAKEAAKRGLPNLKNTVECLPIITRKDTVELLTKYKVYSERELQSRLTIFAEAYTKTVTIEANTAIMMAQTMILPAAIRYQTQVATAATSIKAAGGDAKTETELLKTLSSATASFQKAATALAKAMDHHVEGEPYDHAKYILSTVVPAMAELRVFGDLLETLIADDMWPLPTYREMLYIR